MESLLPLYPKALTEPLMSCGLHLPPSDKFRCNSVNICSSSRTETLLVKPIERPKEAAKSLKKNGIETRRTNKRRRSTTSDVLRLMDSLGVPIPIDIYASLVKECTVMRDSVRAIELHDHIKTQSRFKQPALPLSLFNRLLIMYVSCSCLDIARQVFDGMRIRDFNSWAVMIVGYLECGSHEEALILFVNMLRQINMLKLEFPMWVIVCVLKACVYTGSMELGMQIHGWLLKLGVSDPCLTSSLINFYGKFRCLEGVNFVFDHISRRNTLIWTTKIVYNCKEECFYVAAKDFKVMGQAGIKKNCFTFSSVLRACGRIKDHGQYGQQVHAEAIKLGVDSNDFVQCGLVDMYGKFGLLRDARKVFDIISNKGNIACWNAMLMVYIHNGFYVEGIKLLYQMKAAGLQPQELLLNVVRIACGSINTHGI